MSDSDKERWEPASARPTLAVLLAVVGVVSVAGVLGALVADGGPDGGGTGELTVEAEDPVTAATAGAAATPTPAGTWRTLAPAPIGRRHRHTAVWANRCPLWPRSRPCAEMLVWGGVGDDASDAGAAYDPVSDRWRTLPEAPVSSRAGHTAVWSGGEMLVWGGLMTDGGRPGSAVLDDGAAYDPAVDRWRELPPAPLNPREAHVSVWTGQEMVVWGGRGDGGAASDGRRPAVFADGAAYDPDADAWRTLSPAPIAPRARPHVAWNGEELLLWGGAGVQSFRADGAAYDPTSDTWRRLPPLEVGARVGSRPHGLTDGECRDASGCTLLILRRGDDGDGPRSRLVTYDSAADDWLTLPAVPLHVGRDQTTVWTGRHLLAWGDPAGEPRGTGAAYNADEGRWHPLPASPLTSRGGMTAVWTGAEVVVWGGRAEGSSFPDGAGWSQYPRPVGDEPLRRGLRP